MEQSHMCTAIKTEEETVATSIARNGIDNDLNHVKQETGLVQSVKSESTVLVKKQIAENNSEDNSGQQHVQGTSTSAGAGSLYEINSTSQGAWINVKLELEEMEIGPTVLQHMDIHYALNKSTVDGSNEAMRCSGVKENVEDKLRDSLTPQEAINKERNPRLQSRQHTAQERHLAACSVHVMRMDVFQCDLCHTVYAEKRKLLLHLQVVHECLPQTFLNVKFRRTNKQTAADNKATSHYFSQMAFHKRHLLSVRNKLQQRNNRNAVTTGGSVAGPSNQRRGKNTKTKLKPFECEVCKKVYSSKGDLNLHKRSHSRVELKNILVNYESHIRKKPSRHDKKYAQDEDLTKNMGVQTAEKRFQCKICDKRFAKSNNLTQHMRVHTGEKPFQCKICHARFTHSSNLTTHTRIHKGEKRFRCKNCDASFTQNCSLTQHMKVHTGEKSFQCKICDAKFAYSSNLTQHMKVHTGEKHFQCKICDAKFSQSNNLTQHMIVHTGEKRSKCKICDARFAQNGGLTQHMKVHTGEKRFQCKICDARFAQNGGLTQHMKVHTGEKRFQCKLCDARFAHSSNLTQHMRIHTGEKLFQCKICDSRFAQSSTLTQHMRIHTGEKPFQCKICDARFAVSGDLTNHIRVHTGEKPFQCKFCNTKFAQSSGLAQHIRRHTGEKPFQAPLKAPHPRPRH